MTAENAELHLSLMAAGILTLRWMSEHREIIHDIRRRKKQTQEEMHLFIDHPAVKAILEAFPGAVITEISHPNDPGGRLAQTNDGDDK